MRARVFAKFGPEDGLEVEFGDEATIGRGKDNTVLLNSREVSQHHARIFFDPESTAYWVEDLSSLNGTQLDGEPLIGRQRLGGLHVLSFGVLAEVFFLELDLEPGVPGTAAVETDGKRTRIDAEAPTLPPELERVATSEQTRVGAEVPTLPEGLQAQGGAARKGRKPGAATRVEAAPAELPRGLADTGGPVPENATPTKPETSGFVLEVGAGGGRFELREGENLVGRSSQALVSVANRELSRRHATLRIEGDRVWLRDEGSRNHTFVGGDQISDEVELQPGSELCFGRLEARLLLAAPAATEEAPE